MRNMSFSMTTDAAWAKTKTVTRRLGWWNLKPGDLVQQVEKAQGLKKGERVVPIHVIRIVSSRPEPLDAIARYGSDELDREGFPGQSPAEFVELFMRHNKVGPRAEVNRIEFEYVEKEGE